MSETDPDRTAGGPEIATSTLAEIYARQGLYARALEIYRRIARRGTEDERLAGRIAELERALAGEGAAAADLDEGESPPWVSAGEEIPIPPEPEGSAERQAVGVEEPSGPPLEELAARTGPPEESGGVEEERSEPVAEAPRSPPPQAEADEPFLAWLRDR